MEVPDIAIAGTYSSLHYTMPQCTPVYCRLNRRAQKCKISLGIILTISGSS